MTIRSLLVCCALAVALPGGAAVAPAAEPPAAVVQVSEGPSLPHGTGGHFGGVIDGKPVVAGGTSWSDDRATKTWRQDSIVFQDGAWVAGPQLPQPLADAAYASDGKALYVAGGADGKAARREVLKLDQADPSAPWQTLAPLPEAIEAASGAMLGSTLFVVGGYIEKAPSNRLYALDLSSRDANWRQLAPLPAAGRGWSALVASSGSLYLFGGVVFPPMSAEVRVFADAYRYVAASDQWEPLEGFSFPGYAWSAVAIDDHRIMLAGRVPAVGKIVPDLFLLDLHDMSLSSIGRMVEGNCCMAALKVDPNTWWLAGGEPDTNRSRSKRVTAVRLPRGDAE